MNPLRWRQRLENYERALALLEQAACLPPDALSTLEKEGLIQRFEYTFELAWKTLSDYLDYSGITLTPNTPRDVIKQAFAARVIDDGKLWMDMLDHRNLMSYVYDETRFETTVTAIREHYVEALSALRGFFRSKAVEP